MFFHIFEALTFATMYAEIIFSALALDCGNCIQLVKSQHFFQNFREAKGLITELGIQ